MSLWKRILDVPPMPWPYFNVSDYFQVVLLGEFFAFLVMVEVLLKLIPEFTWKKAAGLAGVSMGISFAIGILTWSVLGLI